MVFVTAIFLSYSFFQKKIGVCQLLRMTACQLTSHYMAGVFPNRQMPYLLQIFLSLSYKIGNPIPPNREHRHSHLFTPPHQTVYSALPAPCPCKTQADSFLSSSPYILPGQPPYKASQNHCLPAGTPPHLYLP